MNSHKVTCYDLVAKLASVRAEIVRVLDKEYFSAVEACLDLAVDFDNSQADSEVAVKCDAFWKTCAPLLTMIRPTIKSADLCSYSKLADEKQIKLFQRVTTRGLISLRS